MTSNNEIKITSLGVERRNLANKINLPDENKFIELNNEIKSGLDDVQKKYDELSKVASPVTKDEYLGGLIKFTNVEKSIEGLLKTIQGLARCTLGAFQANGRNLGAVLELMKMSVVIENELYKQLEDNDCSKENIANLLHDLCSQYNIDSHTIEGLLDQSFNRTITLRTRINDLQEKIFERISKYEEKFDHLDETIRKKEEEFTSCFDCKTAEYNKQLEVRIKECLTVINSYRNELNAARNSYNQEIESAKNFLMDSIKQYNVEVSKRHNVRFEQYERENTELKTQVDDLCSQYNIDSHTIEGLFDQSFNRTITLGTRINDLQEKIFERISKYEEKFDHLDETIRKKEEEFTSCFDCKTAEYNKQLEVRIKECLTVINSYRNELNAARNSYNQEIKSAKNFLMDSIKQYNVEVSKRHNVRFEQYERENTELKTQVDTLSQNVSKLQNRLTWGFVVSIIATIIAVISLVI